MNYHSFAHTHLPKYTVLEHAGHLEDMMASSIQAFRLHAQTVDIAMPLCQKCELLMNLSPYQVRVTSTEWKLRHVQSFAHAHFIQLCFKNTGKNMTSTVSSM